MCGQGGWREREDKEKKQWKEMRAWHLESRPCPMTSITEPPWSFMPFPYNEADNDRHRVVVKIVDTLCILSEKILSRKEYTSTLLFLII